MCQMKLNNKFESDIWNFISLIWESPCKLAITTVQDLLQLDYKSRFNIPGTTVNNWKWRIENLDILDSVISDLKYINNSNSRN